MRVALLAALAVVGCPPFIRAQNGPSVEIDRALFMAPEFQLTYVAPRELAAWSAFRKKYADSPWTVLADRRILALRSH